jgi:hypothetical protein
MVLAYVNISDVCLHAMCRLVRVLLGADSISEGKLETGNPLVVLGVQVEAHLGGIVFTPAPDKVEKWMLDIKSALKAGRLTAGEASKLAGKAFIKTCVCVLCFRAYWLPEAASPLPLSSSSRGWVELCLCLSTGR